MEKNINEGKHIRHGGVRKKGKMMRGTLFEIGHYQGQCLTLCLSAIFQ